MTAQDIPIEEERQFPIRHKYPYTTIDTLNIIIPRGYRLEAAPEPNDIKTTFGHYKMIYQLEEDNLKFIRMICIDKYLIMPSEYADYLSFIKTAVKNDKSCFVFRKIN